MSTTSRTTGAVFQSAHIAALLTAVVLGACASDDGGAATADLFGGVADAGTSWESGGGSDAARWDAGGGSDGFADEGGGWDTGEDAGSWDAGGGQDAAVDTGGGWDAFEDVGAGADAGTEEDAGGNTNVNLGGTQDFGYFRRVVEDGQVPRPGDFEASGFFAEHHTPLPHPDCGERVCVQGLLGVMTSLFEDATCTMLQLGLNSPIVADPDARPPLTLTVVVDTSGSMNAEGKMEFVRLGLHRLVDNLYDDDQLAIVTYSAQARVALPPTSMRGGRSELRDVIDGLTPTSSTNLYAGLQLGFETAMTAYDSGRQNRVLLLSDGQPTAGNTSSASIRELARSYTRDGLGLATIGLGNDFDYALMSGLASDGDGTFYFAENVSAVDEIFAEELSYFTVPVAFDLKLEMTAGQGYDIAFVHGTERWEGDAATGTLEIPSVFLAHRESDDDVTEGGGRRGGGSALIVELMPRMSMDVDYSDGAQVAEVALSFREPGTNRRVEQSIVVDYPHAPWVLLDSGFFQARDTDIAQKSFIMLNVYAGLEAACTDFHAGDPDEGLAKLERLLAAVVDYNEEVGDVDIEYDIELIEDLMAVMRAQGARLPGEFEPREDPWQAD